MQDRDELEKKQDELRKQLDEFIESSNQQLKTKSKSIARLIGDRETFESALIETEGNLRVPQNQMNRPFSLIHQPTFDERIIKLEELLS